MRKRFLKQKYATKVNGAKSDLNWSEWIYRYEIFVDKTQTSKGLLDNDTYFQLGFVVGR